MIIKNLSSLLKVGVSSQRKSSKIINICSDLLFRQHYFISEEGGQKNFDGEKKPFNRNNKRQYSPRNNQRKDGDRYNNNKDFKRNEGDRSNFEGKLITQLQQYRIKMETSNNSAKQFCYFAKKISDYYKRGKHFEFVQLKGQLQGMLNTLNELDYSNIQLQQYYHLMDFLRIISYIQSINYSLFTKSRENVFGVLKQFQSKIETLSLKEISELYCKINPIYHPESFSVSGMLHDLLAEDIKKKKMTSLPIFQIYIIIRSIGKKEFLSFPDKKILQMLLIEIKKIDITEVDMLVRIAVALKDIDIEVNISDHRLIQICYDIYEKTFEAVSDKINYQVTEYLLHTKKTDHPHFIEMFKKIYKRFMRRLDNTEKYHFLQLKNLRNLVELLAGHQQFTQEDQDSVIRYTENLILDNQKTSRNSTTIQIQILELLRLGFFTENICYLDKFFYDKMFQFKWSFPLEYSMQNQPFPSSFLVQKFKQNKLEFNPRLPGSFKIAVALQVQSKLQPQIEQLKAQYQNMLKNITEYKWKQQQVQNLLKMFVTDYPLMLQFHRKFSHLYMSKIQPTIEQMNRQKQLKKGERSHILRFWQLLLLQQEIPQHLVYKIPHYCIPIVCFRQSKIKHKELYPKPALLIALNIKINSQMMKFSGNQAHSIVEVLIAYANYLNEASQNTIGLYFNLISSLIDQYSSLKHSIVPYANHLFSKISNIRNEKIRRSSYYRNFLKELLSNVGIISSDNNYIYLKTAILREALNANLLYDRQFLQIQVDFFSNHEQLMLQSLKGQLQHSGINQSSLLRILKLPKLPEGYQAYLGRVNSVIKQADFETLNKYLIHYNIQPCKVSKMILPKLLQEFFKKVDLKKLNLHGFLDNLAQMQLSKKQLEETIDTIAAKITEDPSQIYFSDHQQLLTFMSKHNITCKDYLKSLWRLIRQGQKGGPLIIKLLLELGRYGDLKEQDLKIAGKYSYYNPVDYLVLLVQKQDVIIDFKNNIEYVTTNFGRPVPQSIVTHYLEKKYNIVFAKSKKSTPFMAKPNTANQNFIKQLQSAGIPVKVEEISGQTLFFIGSKILLIFTKKNSMKQQGTFTKILKFFYPQKALIDISFDAKKKEILYTFQQLTLADKELFSDQKISTINYNFQAS